MRDEGSGKRQGVHSFPRVAAENVSAKDLGAGKFAHAEVEHFHLNTFPRKNKSDVIVRERTKSEVRERTKRRRKRNRTLDPNGLQIGSHWIPTASHWDAIDIYGTILMGTHCSMAPHWNPRRSQWDTNGSQWDPNRTTWLHSGFAAHPRDFVVSHAPT